MIAKLKLFWLLLAAIGGLHQEPQPITWNCYESWTTDGIHLFMADPGTPYDFSDDIVADYEDNRRVKITVMDRESAAAARILENHFSWPAD